jgi:hypothetical protein
VKRITQTIADNWEIIIPLFAVTVFFLGAWSLVVPE